MLIVNTTLPKLCHAEIGSVVKIPNEAGCIEDSPYMLVCADTSNPKLKIGRRAQMHGLYDDERPLFFG